MYVVGQLGIGGLERQLYYLLSRLDYHRYQPAVVVWNFNPSEKYFREIDALKVPIYGLPADCAPLNKLKLLRAIALKVAPEVIHSYGFHTNFAVYYSARGRGIVPIGSLRSDFATVKKNGGVVRGALNGRWPRLHISNSAACAEAARQDSTFFSPRHYSVVRNALDLDCFSEHNVPPQDRTYVAGVGSLLSVKRWDRLLKAVQNVKALINDDVEFRIAGAGPLRESLEKLAADLRISESVKFVGTVQDVPAFLRGAQFLVHTSESEGCPNVVMEAMACALPVIAMDAGDISCLIEDEHTGFMINQDDELALVDRILRLHKNPSLRCSMGRAAREKAEREFGLDRLVAQTLDAYRTAGWNEA